MLVVEKTKGGRHEIVQRKLDGTQENTEVTNGVLKVDGNLKCKVSGGELILDENQMRAEVKDGTLILETDNH